jgi:hypothetical protein
MSGACSTDYTPQPPSASASRRPGTLIPVLNTSGSYESSSSTAVTPSLSRAPVSQQNPPGSSPSLPMIYTVPPSRSAFAFSHLEPVQIISRPPRHDPPSASGQTTDSIPSPTARSRRAPSPSETPPMHLESSSSKYTLDVYLPTDIQSEMVTISAKKGNRLDVVADAWHREQDCGCLQIVPASFMSCRPRYAVAGHYEWQISFEPNDVDMTTIRAKFDVDGHLTIHIPRVSEGSE